MTDLTQVSHSLSEIALKQTFVLSSKVTSELQRAREPHLDCRERTLQSLPDEGIEILFLAQFRWARQAFTEVPSPLGVVDLARDTHWQLDRDQDSSYLRDRDKNR
jgi:hypothetical protein